MRYAAIEAERRSPVMKITILGTLNF